MAKNRPPKNRKFPKKFRATLEKVAEQKQLRDEGFSEEEAKKLIGLRSLIKAVDVGLDTCYRDLIADTPYHGAMFYDEDAGVMRSSLRMTERARVHVARTDPPWASWPPSDEMSGSE